ncbi:hypothetical protein NLX83_28875 [Allokutzneria sp. A3M-2-11 16]|uniref:hypothetical protein n=1 Tax=Allokutzneria sp. A3M-2-11 16 TaxID=2962043 RepID=UPI0020B6B6CB|nr:hypothetical protein [Allokutzneria sp. A3M-2-11 16]MCP3803299.1 hypothetical protein [Allokutzneria sp. A3M-2-11 16]
MTADPDMRLWWALLVEGVGGLAFYLAWKAGWLTWSAMPWSFLLAGLPFAMIAALLALVPPSTTRSRPAHGHEHS